MKSVDELLKKDEFERSGHYDNAWMMDNQMGPNALWLAEWLCSGIELKEGMRVLDLGCGKAMTSIFMAREFGVQVWAADLWMNPDNNFRRICEAGLDKIVYPVKAEAHSLPFAAGFFDAVISVDSYQYYGTDQLYMSYISRFIKNGGLIGIVVPSLMKEIYGNIPEHLNVPQSNGKVFWDNACYSFKTATFWKRLWKTSGVLEDIKAEILPDGWRHWRDFEKALELAGKSIFPSDAEALEKDGGEYICFVKMTAAKSSDDEYNLYDSNLGAVAGVDK